MLLRFLSVLLVSGADSFNGFSFAALLCAHAAATRRSASAQQVCCESAGVRKQIMIEWERRLTQLILTMLWPIVTNTCHSSAQVLLQFRHARPDKLSQNWQTSFLSHGEFMERFVWFVI